MSPFQNRLAAFCSPFERTFTAAILTVQTALCEQCSSAILKERGDTILFTRVFADPTWGLPHRARFAVARLLAAAPAHGSRILRAAGRGRKSTRLNSSHLVISYALFCLKKKN